MTSFRLVALAVVAAVFCALFHGLVFSPTNLSFRDAGHFYYPYYLHIEQEWRAGRVPLWSAAENGGVPLAANPTSCVFYPGKLLFAILPYAQAFKWYHLLHLLLAVATTYGAARGFGASELAAAFSGLAYAFGGFVLFQLYNIVFLVGAAWLPAGVLAVDHIVRRQSPRATLGLAAVLALQVLGGDPEIAYVTGVAAGVYALLFHLGGWVGAVAVTGGLSLGALVVHSRTLGVLARTAMGAAPPRRPASSLTVGLLAAAAIVAVLAAGFLWARSRDRRAAAMRLPWRTLRQLGGAALLAGALAAVQLLPTYEFVQYTDRAAPEAPHESAGFSLFPLRVVEWFVPSFFGRTYGIEARWAPFDNIETGLWIPDLYMGLSTALFALAAMRFWRGDPTVKFLTWLVVLSLWASMGRFALGNLIDENTIIGLAFRGGQANPVLNARQGEEPMLLYGNPAGPYWLMEQTLPGFRSFRYPSKLLAVTALGLSLLAAGAIDRLVGADARRLRVALLAIAGATLVSAACLALFAGPFERIMSFDKMRGSFGPLDVSAGRRQTMFGLAQTAFVATICWWIVRRMAGAEQRRANHCKALLLILLGVDLAFAHRWLVLTDDQQVIDAEPAVIAAIRQAEASDSDGQPFRVHRTRQYHPLAWSQSSSPDRFLTMSRWERNTIQPKYGLPFGVQYATTVGTMSIYDVEFFFAPWNVLTPPDLRAALRNKPERITYFPRVGFNLWNTKYFVLPKFNKPDDEDRGNYTLLSTRDGNPCPVVAQSDALQDDYVVLKNPECLPRARLVHQADLRSPLRTMDRDERRPIMEELVSRHLDAGQPLWRNPKYPEYPHDRMAIIETEAPALLNSFQSGAPPDKSESVSFEVYESNYLRIRAKANSPGYLVLSDTYFPGWSATVDGQPAEIHRANRVMRAVGLSAGEHVVEMRYRCIWFEIGAVVSFLAIGSSFVAWLCCRREAGSP